jgi:hypothetical protein
MDDSKQCFRCSEFKDRSEFNKHNQKRDGLRPECKSCQSEAQSKAWASLTEEERSLRGKHRYLLAKERDPDGTDRYEKVRSFRNKNPEMYLSYQLVGLALRRGILIKPSKCEWCSKEGYVEASHVDYFRPLDIIWLCRFCHRCRDDQLREWRA